MKAMVNQYYPGLEIGCTEYNWGDEPNLNGATTQADVLGIYGREGFDLATRWTVATNTNTTPTTYYVTYLASQIYRNYDGNDSTFGDTSVEADCRQSRQPLGVCALRGSDGAMTVMVINKQQGSTPVTVSLANFSNAGTAQAWQINSASQTSITHLSDVNVANNSVSTTVPSQSITLFVIPSGSTLSAPSAPTGLAATVGSGTVTLTWNAAGGAISYTVKRGIASGGPYATVASLGSSPDQFHGYRPGQRDHLLLRRNRLQFGWYEPQLGGTSRDSAGAAHVYFFGHRESKSGDSRCLDHDQRERQGHGQYVDQWRGANHDPRPERRCRAHPELHRAELYVRSIASLFS